MKNTGKQNMTWKTLALGVLSMALATPGALAQTEETHWWDRFRPNASGKTATTQKAPEKPPDPKTTKMWYYDYRDSQKKCLTWEEAQTLHIPRTYALKSCEDKDRTD